MVLALKSTYFLNILLSITTHTAGFRYTHVESQCSREVCVLVLPQRNFSSFISLSLAISRSSWCSQLPSDTLPLSCIINRQESSCQWTRPLEYQEAEKLDIHPKLNGCLITDAWHSTSPMRSHCSTEEDSEMEQIQLHTKRKWCKHQDQLPGYLLSSCPQYTLVFRRKHFKLHQGRWDRTAQRLDANEKILQTGRNTVYRATV